METKEIKIIDWNEISASRKDKINGQRAIFITGPRDMSAGRIQQITEQLAKNKRRSAVIWGCLKDDYIPGYEDAPQFKALALEKLNSALQAGSQGSTPPSSTSDVTILHYYQRDWKHLLKELGFGAVILINGSWHKSLHLREEYWLIERKRTPYKYLSPFKDEAEAKAYTEILQQELKGVGKFDAKKKYSDKELLELASQVAKRSFDTSWQTGAVLAKQGKVLAVSWNTVVPFEAYALHYGASRERNFAPANDLNHYDSNHAEMELLINALKNKQDLRGCTLYINLLPCPTCARALARCNIKEIVYMHDHSDGYGHKLLEASGKALRRIA